MLKILKIKPRGLAGLLAASVMTLSTGVAMASLSATDEATLRSKFALADKDHNGQLTLDEAKAGMPRVAQGFSQIDGQNRGYITLDEILVFAAAR
jgi:Ca2+-binding EF-hand superfamily protein